MKERLTNLETAGYLLALFFGILIRFARLGALPLTDAEAVAALQSLSIANGQPTVIGPAPGPVLFTSALFFLFQSTNTLARLWPAVFGSLLILAPLLFRRPLGRLPAVLLAFALAFDPGLVALSRQAGEATWAIAALVLAAGFLLNRAVVTAGIFLGLAVLGGPTVWAGLVFALIAYGVWWLLAAPEQRSDWQDRLNAYAELPWRNLLLWFVGSFLVFGSLFFSTPEGISAAAASIAGFVRSIGTPSGLAVESLIMAVVAYAPLAVLFGIVQGVRGFVRRDPLDRWLALFWLVSIAAALLMAGRSFNYLAWTMIPLWALAARLLANLQAVARTERLWVAGIGALYALLLVFAWLSALGLSHTVTPEDSQVRVISFAGALLLLVLTGILLAWGWSLRVTLLGSGWGIAVVLAILLVRATVSAAGLGAKPENQLWRLGTPVLNADLLEQTVHDLSEWQTGDPKSLDITVAGIDSPALQWLLRDFRQVRFETVLTAQVTPGVVVTAGEETPVLTTQYRGQDFLWAHQPVWQDFTLGTWWNWLAFRQAPAENRSLILWARADVFPGGSIPAGR